MRGPGLSLCFLAWAVLAGPPAAPAAEPVADTPAPAYDVVHLNRYMRQVSEIRSRTQKEIASMAEGLRSAAQSGNTGLRDALIAQVDQVLTRAFEELNAVDPPVILKPYHQRIFDAYVYQKVANDALLRGDAASADAFNREAAKADAEAFAALEQTLKDLAAAAPA
jgi:hypothetical protein